jgi:hypothetical protein
MFTTSITGLGNALALLEKGAVRVNKDEWVEGYIDMRLGVHQAQANISAIRTEDKMLGTLLDIFG